MKTRTLKTIMLLLAITVVMSACRTRKEACPPPKETKVWVPSDKPVFTSAPTKNNPAPAKANPTAQPAQSPIVCLKDRAYITGMLPESKGDTTKFWANKVGIDPSTGNKFQMDEGIFCYATRDMADRLFASWTGVGASRMKVYTILILNPTPRMIRGEDGRKHAFHKVEGFTH